MTQLAGVTYYRHSGRFRPGGLIVALALGSVIGILVGGLYGYITMQAALHLSGKALGLVNIVACLIVAFVIGNVAAEALRSRHVRSVLVGVLASMLVTGVTLYAAWVARLYVLPPQAPGEVKLPLLALASPGVLVDKMQSLNDRGIRVPGKAKPAAGMGLAPVWLVEAATFLVIGIKAARKRINENVYCESCRKWGTQRTLARLAPDDPAALKASLRTGDFSRLEALGPSAAPAATELVLEGCTDCESVQALTVNVTSEKIDPKSKVSTVTTQTVVRRMNLAPEQIVALAGIAAKSAVVEGDGAAMGEDTSAPGAESGPIQPI